MASFNNFIIGINMICLQGAVLKKFEAVNTGMS